MRELEPRMRPAEVSTEKARRLATKLGIAGIPTPAPFAGGREIARQSGALPARRTVDRARAATA